jgi:hypothetical protein
MSFPWGIPISLMVLGLAYLMKHVGEEVLEEPHLFWRGVIFFFVVYVIAAFAVGTLNPLELIPGTSPAPTLISLPF